MFPILLFLPAFVISNSFFGVECETRQFFTPFFEDRPISRSFEDILTGNDDDLSMSKQPSVYYPNQICPSVWYQNCVPSLLWNQPTKLAAAYQTSPSAFFPNPFHPLSVLTNSQMYQDLSKASQYPSTLIIQPSYSPFQPTDGWPLKYDYSWIRPSQSTPWPVTKGCNFWEQSSDDIHRSSTRPLLRSFDSLFRIVPSQRSKSDFSRKPSLISTVSPSIRSNIYESSYEHPSASDLLSPSNGWSNKPLQEMVSSFSPVFKSNAEKSSDAGVTDAVREPSQKPSATPSSFSDLHPKEPTKSSDNEMVGIVHLLPHVPIIPPPIPHLPIITPHIPLLLPLLHLPHKHPHHHPLFIHHRPRPIPVTTYYYPPGPQVRYSEVPESRFIPHFVPTYPSHHHILPIQVNQYYPPYQRDNSTSSNLYYVPDGYTVVPRSYDAVKKDIGIDYNLNLLPPEYHKNFHYNYHHAVRPNHREVSSNPIQALQSILSPFLNVLSTVTRK